LKIHHIGYVVNSIDSYLQDMIVTNTIKRVYDDIQKSDMILIKLDNVFIELIEPKSKDAFTYNFLKKNGSSYHHICYEVNNSKEAKNIIKNKKMIVILDWVYAPLLESSVLFAYSRNREVVEFVLSK